MKKLVILAGLLTLAGCSQGGRNYTVSTTPGQGVGGPITISETEGNDTIHCTSDGIQSSCTHSNP